MFFYTPWYNIYVILRNIEEKVFSWLDKKKILIIRGARQVGKTTLIKKILNKLKDENQNCFYFSMDRYDHLELAQDPINFYEYLKDKGLDPKKKNYVFIDEFQYIKEAGRFLKILFDEHKDHLQLIVTGSSSLEIAKNSEYLTGRKIDFQMQGLSFKEFFSYKSSLKNISLKISEEEKIKSFWKNHQKQLEFFFFDYLKFGSYPEIAVVENIEDKKEIIKEITNTYLKKDITAFLKVADPIAFNKLIEILASQIGNLVNYSELANTLKINRKTVERYIEILEGTYVFKNLKPYASNKRKTLTKTPKIFIKDFGLQKVSLNYFPQDSNLIQGSEVENFIFNHIYSDDLYFYRTSAGAEIDFVDLESKQVIEVKYSKKVNSMTKNILNFIEDHADLKISKKIMASKDQLKIDLKNKQYIIPAPLFPFIDFDN